MNRGHISLLLRKLRLMHFTDRLRYLYFKRKNKEINRTFKEHNPDISLPPDYYIYEAFQINYTEYYTKSKESAKWIVDHYKKFKKKYPEVVLDWGCGPGRIIRHLPDILDPESKVHGTDYNESSIKWCKENLRGINFNHNSLDASLPYSNNQFDFIFGISIFTHLSIEKHWEWSKELSRISKPGGILMFTTHGSIFKTKLSKKERGIFDKGQIVVRGNVKEGHRTYTAYHPSQFMKKLFSENGLKVLQHSEQTISNSKAQQDIWVLEKER